MGIKFVPSSGMVLMCDFDTGFVPPEMTKVRHVVVVSPRHRRNSGTCLVVPFSTVAPNPVEPFHYRIPADSYSFFKKNADVWAKGDLVSHVSFGRLDRVLDNGKYCSPSLKPEDLKCIQSAVWQALGQPEVVLENMEVVEKTVSTSIDIVEKVSIALDKPKEKT
jgi:mRNA interferase MazF